MPPEAVTDAVIGVALAGFFLFTGTASWYFPTVFLRLFDGDDVSPWPQLLFTPAAYVGAYVLSLTIGLGLYAVHGVVALCIGAAVVCRHRRSTANPDSLWPPRWTGQALVALGAGLALFSVVRTLGAA
ncbi:MULTISPECIES: hypothetical protein [Haloarcula]|uniref:Uncharacterized protein n=1 Tax=Haloarcula pellucida TaxID=1427151 RepID=A0A830GTC5_9EURY|nr:MULTISPECIES: hypothetical protein [Halomicroarcula]MBX0350219.1 hypothetical protein [Halomicroarcula pellucida]MDS0277679.1 hypothetical protein [Halomicroarcula sp. S1AR25-4]GGO00975.1 hypothetical protein GCM10009030_34180 [Halomicroarcula pellucida]